MVCKSYYLIMGVNFIRKLFLCSWIPDQVRNDYDIVLRCGAPARQRGLVITLKAPLSLPINPATS